MIDLICPCKSDSGTKFATTPVPKTKGTRRKQTLNYRLSFDVAVSDDDKRDSSIGMVDENEDRHR